MARIPSCACMSHDGHQRLRRVRMCCAHPSSLRPTSPHPLPTHPASFRQQKGGGDRSERLARARPLPRPRPRRYLRHVGPPPGTAPLDPPPPLAGRVWEPEDLHTSGCVSHPSHDSWASTDACTLALTVSTSNRQPGTAQGTTLSAHPPTPAHNSRQCVDIDQSVRGNPWAVPGCPS